ncbi:hypothetical protein A2U01_0004328 [Trifolium medium]|uniref:Uncharacterized protein n=1 Tax=Trifolium medium TaxID=97028 RepID=A0A392M8R9_9FABA|nr:hypothetical protein [Trifolium medium]
MHSVWRSFFFVEVDFRMVYDFPARLSVRFIEVDSGVDDDWRTRFSGLVRAIGAGNGLAAWWCATYAKREIFMED